MKRVQLAVFAIGCAAIGAGIGWIMPRPDDPMMLDCKAATLARAGVTLKGPQMYLCQDHRPGAGVAESVYVHV